MATEQAPKSARELLDDAQALAEGGNPSGSVKLLEELISRYPRSPEAEVAFKALRKSVDERTRAQLVRVVDVDIAFGSLVMLMVKAAIAAIPAAIILAGIGFAIAVALRVLTL